MNSRSNVYAILQSIIKKRDFQKRYENRRKHYRNLAENTPCKYEDILCTDNKWCCHGLAFRMATYPSEIVFERLDSLIQKASRVKGWENESRKGTEWSKDYAVFFHRLWMLQCVEYYIDQRFSIAFPVNNNSPEPGLVVTCREHGELYVECYFKTKWWPTETFLEDILGLTHPNLQLERGYNLKTDNYGSNLDKALDRICEILLSDKLRKAEQDARIRSPIILFEETEMRVSLRGQGEHQPGLGYPSGRSERSARVYLEEIVRGKEGKNNLPNRHPNCLMVNALGIDFQRLFFRSSKAVFYPKSASIDTLMLCRCGIDQQLSDSIDRFCLACENEAATG